MRLHAFGTKSGEEARAIQIQPLAQGQGVRGEEFDFQADTKFLDRHYPKDKEQMLYIPAPLPWRKVLQRDERNNTYNSSNGNAMLCFRECPEISGLIWFERKTERLFVIGHMPRDSWLIPAHYRKMTYDDLTELLEFLQTDVPLPLIDRDTTYWACRKVAKAYHTFSLDDYPQEDES